MGNWLPIAAVVGGFVLLVLGADRFVLGAKNLALRLGMSPLMVGMVVVGVGTSAPEMLVSGMAALEGDAALAIGNAVGSNISNLGLVLGLTALVAPIPLQASLVKREFPFLLALMLAYFAIFWDGRLDQWDGAALLIGLVLVMWRSFRQDAAREPGEETHEGGDVASPTPGESTQEGSPPATEGLSLPAASLWFGLGLIMMIGGSRFIVWGAVEVARSFQVSELVIGLTIVAIGTSLPEVAASVTAAIKREHELAVGNVLGSNVFNLLLVLPFPAFMDPKAVDPAIAQRDYPVMIGMTLLLCVLGWLGLKRGFISRFGGAILLSGYLAYAGFLVSTVMNS